MGLLGAFAAPAMVTAKDPSVWTLFAYLLVVEAACLAVARYKNWWWFALATLAGACAWPFLWMLDSHFTAFDMLPLGLYLLLSVCGYIALDWNTPEPAGEQDWVAELQNLTPPDWVVWGASAATAFVLFVVVASADYSTTGLVFAWLIAALYLFVGRRHAIFDSLPVIAAVLVLAIAATMPVPTSIVPVPSFHRAPFVPVELHFFAETCIAFAALFAIGGFTALWGAKRPALWASVSAAVPILLLVIAYYRIVDFGVDYVWAGIAVGLAAVNLSAAERVERYREARGLDVTLAFYAAAIVASISLAAAMSVREAWLTVALSIQLPALAWINTRHQDEFIAADRGHRCVHRAHATRAQLQHPPLSARRQSRDKLGDLRLRDSGDFIPVGRAYIPRTQGRTRDRTVAGRRACLLRAADLAGNQAVHRGFPRVDALRSARAKPAIDLLACGRQRAGSLSPSPEQSRGVCRCSTSPRPRGNPGSPAAGRVLQSVLHDRFCRRMARRQRAVPRLCRAGAVRVPLGTRA